MVDGYAGYNKFKVKQRCWAHVLREAELLAAIHGGNLEELHHCLQSIFSSAKKLPPDITDEELGGGGIDNVAQIAGIYKSPRYLTFGGKLENAAPDLFTFVKYHGMPPTNNMSERTLRPVVLHKKIWLMFQSAIGIQQTIAY